MHKQLTPEEALEIENRQLREMAARYGALQARKEAERSGRKAQAIREAKTAAEEGEGYAKSA